jgi:hypothetical protein
MNDTTSQCNSILKYLKSGSKISGIDALELFGCFRLPARIHDLKKRGFHILGAMEQRGNKKYKVYYMECN